jgi:hypothetical protein
MGSAVKYPEDYKPVYTHKVIEKMYNRLLVTEM